MKTTKKLISTLLALVMMLTIIPMGTMTAMAYDSNDLCECGHRYLSHVADPGFSCLSCDNGNCTSGNFTLHKCSALEKKNGRAATCTADGWKDYYKCTLSACNKMYASSDTTGTVITDLTTFIKSSEGKIPAKGHSYTTKASSQKASDATCTAAATYYVQCDNCTAVDTTKTVPVGSPSGHSFTNYVSNNDATCTEDGTKTASCDYKCGATNTVTDKDTATGHKFISYTSNNNATCIADGTKTASCDYGCGTTDTITDEDTATGHHYTSKVTKKATYAQAGVRTYTCSNCGNKYTKAIPRLKATSAAKYNNSTKMNAGFEVSSSSKDVTVNWGKVAGADGYMIYANYCGKDTKPVLIKTIKGEATKTCSFSKIDGKKIDLTKNLKVYVVAYSTIDGKKVQLAKTIVGHVVGGKSKKYTNSTKITVKNSKVTLNVGKTSTIKATVTYKDPKKKPVSDKHAAEKRYRSSNKAVATVDANGKITAVGKGTCTVYVFAKNGTSAKVTVTVK